MLSRLNQLRLSSSGTSLSHAAQPVAIIAAFAAAASASWSTRPAATWRSDGDRGRHRH
jgi:hypothetical protein